MAGFDLSILSSLLPMAGAGASGFMEGQERAIAANQAKQQMYLAEQEEARAQELFGKQKRSLDNEHAKFMQDFDFAEDNNPVVLARNKLATRANVPGLNPEIASDLGVDPNDLSAATFGEQLGLLSDKKGREYGMTKARTPRPSSDPTRRLRHLESLYERVRLNPPNTIQELIPYMDAQMKQLMQTNPGAITVQNVLAYIQRDIEMERKRLGYSDNKISAPTSQVDKWDEVFDLAEKEFGF